MGNCTRAIFIEHPRLSMSDVVFENSLNIERLKSCSLLYSLLNLQAVGLLSVMLCLSFFKVVTPLHSNNVQPASRIIPSTLVTTHTRQLFKSLNCLWDEWPHVLTQNPVIRLNKTQRLDFLYDKVLKIIAFCSWIKQCPIINTLF